MKITSPAFNDNSTIPEQYGCHGADINPALEISGVPAEAKSLTLIIDDPDSPGGTFTHWLLFNIDPAITSIAENSVPAGAVNGTNSFGAANYGGPCPFAGTHHYIFKLYALDIVLNLPAGSDLSEVTAAMTGHILEQADLTGTYSH